MVRDLSKLVLRAYNNEADNLVRTLKPYALDAAKGRLEKARDLIARLGASMKIAVTSAYHDLRIKELELTADYQARLAEERERERGERARLKDEEAARREFEREQERLGKERKHYENAIQRLEQKGDSTAVAEAQAKLQEIDGAIAGIAERAANIRAGYVYVISNIGSFGERVIKIGLTRRLDPLDRVRELGDASVPFRFDVHAIIFSDDAVALETSLHEMLGEQRVNLANLRREFFYAAPGDVRDALVKLHGNLLSFVETPEALEWHQSENVRAGRVSAKLSP